VCAWACRRARAHAHPAFRLVSREVQEIFYWYKAQKSDDVFPSSFSDAKGRKVERIGEMRIFCNVSYFMNFFLNGKKS